MITTKLSETHVRNRYDYNFIKMKKPMIGNRDQPFAQRLADYMNKYTLTAKRFAELSAEYSGKYGTKVTEDDIKGYLYAGKSPKIDKLFAISQVMGVSIDYFCGYGSRNRKSKNPIIEARYRKRKKGD